MLFELSEATAARRRVPLHLVDATDGITPETGESGGQPQLSKNGAAFGSTSATLTAVGNGSYYVELTAAELDTVGMALVRYKSANTAEAQVAIQVVGFDPFAVLSTLDAAGIRTAVGLASANLDTQLVAIDDAIDTEVATLVTNIATILAAVDTEIAAIKVKTDQLTFTGAARVDANVAAIDNSTTGVDKLSAHLPAILKVLIGVGSTTTSLVLNATTGIDGAAPSTTNDFYTGRVIVFTSGALAGQATDITDYVGSTATLTVTALTSGPGSGTLAVIV